MNKMLKLVMSAAWGVLAATGAWAAELPSGYTAVECIIAPKGAFIDTGYRPNQNTRTMMDVTVQGKAEYWFSVTDVDYKTGAYALCNDYDLGIYYAVNNDGGSFKASQGIDGCVPNGRHTVGITPYSLLVDGEVWATKQAQGNFRLQNNLYLFGSNAASTRPSNTAYTRNEQTSIICHGCTISEGETPKRYFVPCVRASDAVAGLYETVEGKFYQNNGTGVFSTPESVLPFKRTLTSGTYEVTESFAFIAPTIPRAAPTDKSALRIADGAAVTLNLAAGVEVVVRGGDAFEAWGAGAGIEVPANATLRVTGAGKLVAFGGKGANGCNGVNGGNGSAESSTGHFTSGAGGAGGWGGGGAGAGIGGAGGNGGGGGNGGKSVSATNWSYTDVNGNSGDNGGAGHGGGSCGTVSIEDTVTVVATGGAAGAADGAGGAAGGRDWCEGSTYYFGVWGGGGGGGGAKGGAAQDIGGGGSGGYGGGGGGSGAYLSRYKRTTFNAMRVWGGGGSGVGDGASGGASSREGEKVSGGAGGAKGAEGARGGSGTLMTAEGALACAEEGRYTVGRISDTEYILFEQGKLYRVVNDVRNELSYSVVDSGTWRFDDGKWYVVRGTVSRTDRILVSGAANLVLLHSASLTVDCSGKGVISADYAPGIELSDDNSLRVFGVEPGSLVAKGSRDAAGIGTAFNAWGRSCGTCGHITIYGGNVTAVGGNQGAGIGGGEEGNGGTVTINGGSVTAFGCDGADAIGAGARGSSSGSLTLGVRVLKIDDNHWREGRSVSFVMPTDLRVASVTGAAKTWMEGRRYYALNPEPNHTVTFTFELSDPASRLIGNPAVSFLLCDYHCELEPSLLPHAEDIVLDSLDYALPNGEITRAENVYPVHACSEVSVLSQAWYRVSGNVTRSAGLTVTGEVNLILCDGASLTVNGGILVEEGNTLNIFSQQNGTGRLVANGSEYCAGIGGRMERGAGTVTINSGTVTATSGGWGAGIGGGHNGNGGKVTINGGKVTASSGGWGAGIGGGWHGAGGNVTINSGMVTATGGLYGAGIGGGYAGRGATVTISGGTVTAMGGNGGAGIGGGYGCDGGFVTINGGSVTATGGSNGAGIGGGWQSAGGTVAINGGTVTATGGWQSAGIGGSLNGAGGTVTISGGSVKASSIQDRPKNGNGLDVYRVIVEAEGLNAEKLTLEGLDGYGMDDVVPIDGRVYLYLPDGTYSFALSGGTTICKYYAVVNGRDVKVEPQAAETGFFVNGADVGSTLGTGWQFDKNGCLHLTGSGTYILSGLATNDEVQVSVEASDTTLVLSNAVVYARGRPALTVAQNLSGVSLGMAGDVSYLAATNDASGTLVSAVQADSSCEIFLAPGGERLESMICVFNFGNASAVAGQVLSVRSGSLCVWADAEAAESPVGYDAASEIMAAGDEPGSVRYAGASSDAKCVLVAPLCRVSVPVEIPGIASYVVSDATEQIAVSETANATNVFKVMEQDNLTIDFVAAEGYEIISGGQIVIPSITNDVTVGTEAYPVPDVRKRLSVTLPATLEGETYVVTENGNEVEKVGGGGESGVAVYPVRSGLDVEIVCTALEGWRIVSATNVVTFADIRESQVLTAADLPQAWRVFTVTVPETEGVYFDLSSSDGQMARTVSDAALILSGSEVTVTFTPRDGYRITANGAKTWILTCDVTFGTTEGFPFPAVEGIPGTFAAPWSVGVDVVAYTNAEGVLTIGGTGAMDDFENAADVPWDPETVTSVVVSEGVERLGANAFAALNDAVTIKTTTLGVSRFIAPALSAATSAQPAGTISPAEFERIDIIDGKAYLGVSVYTNATLEAENSGVGGGWGVATNGVIEVPAPGKSGFYILKSKAVESQK